MRLVYLGSPDAAVAPLRALVDAGHEVLLVVSQPDRRRGRGASLSPSPVKAAAVALGIPVTDQPEDILDAVSAGAELGVVVAYGRLIRPPLLATLGFVNIHFSLLPRWRGAAPVERAILAGDTETGCCLMALEEGLDTGGVYDRVVTPIGPEETAAALRDRLVAIGTDMLLRNLRDGLGVPVPQHGEASYAAKIDPAELRIDWGRKASEIHRLVRIGGAWTTLAGRRLKILSARIVSAPMDSAPMDSAQADRAPRNVGPGSITGTTVVTGAGLVELGAVQPEGKAPMEAEAWRRGLHLDAGARLGD